MKIRCKESGLTLIEVMIALVIVSIAFGALLQSTRNTITAYQHLRAQIGARWVASNILTMRELGSVVTEAGRAQQGRQTFFDQNWYWNMQETRTHQEFIHRISVEVRLTDSLDSPVVYKLDGFVYAGKSK